MKRQYNTVSSRDPDGLTRRERACADLLVAGATTAEMAAQLGTSATAVQSALGRVYRKLGVDCAAYAIDALRGRQQLRELSEPFAESYPNG